MTMINKENIDKNKTEETRSKSATANKASGCAAAKACKSANTTDTHEKKNM